MKWAIIVGLLLLGSFWFAWKIPYLRMESLSYDPLDVKAPFGTLYGRSLDDQNISFIIVGDWGLKCELQSIVAQQMAKIAQQIKAQFIINTGDNFYSFGVSSINDPQFRQVFEEKFTQDSEFNRLPWYSVLGNHDFRGDIEPQIEYSKKNPRWVMPGAYYNFSIPYSKNSPPIEFLMLHTSVIACPDINEVPIDSMFWRGECEVLTFSKAARQKSSFATTEDLLAWANQTSISRSEQLNWLNSVLEEQGRAKDQWRIVVGHHAMESASFVHGSIEMLNKDLEPLLSHHGVDLYACGHDHNLQHIKRENTFHHIVSGGGSYASLLNSFHPVNQRYPGLLHGSATFGFFAVTVSPTQMYMEIIDFLGNSLYNYTITK